MYIVVKLTPMIKTQNRLSVYLSESNKKTLKMKSEKLGVSKNAVVNILISKSKENE